MNIRFRSDAIHNLNQKMRYRHGVIKEPKLTPDIQKEDFSVGEN